MLHDNFVIDLERDHRKDLQIKRSLTPEMGILAITTIRDASLEWREGICEKNNTKTTKYAFENGYNNIWDEICFSSDDGILLLEVQASDKG